MEPSCAAGYLQRLSINSASTMIGKLRTNLKVVIDGESFLLSKLKRKTKGVTSFIAKVPSYQAKVKIVIDNNSQETRIILCSDTNMTEYEILDYYSKREIVSWLSTSRDTI